MTTPMIAAVGAPPVETSDLPGRDMFSVALAEAFDGLPDPADLVEAVYVGAQSE
jgi:acetyl-CoA C-acetyltransferase/acetyl-CoA acyltransferase